MKGNKVHLYDKKQPRSDNLIPVYSDIKLLDLDTLLNYSNEEIDKFLTSPELTSLTKKLASVSGTHKDDTKIKTYSNSLRKYKHAIRDYFKSTKYENNKDDIQSREEYLSNLSKRNDDLRDFLKKMKKTISQKQQKLKGRELNEEIDIR